MDPKGIAVVLAALWFFFSTPAPVINSIIPSNGANNSIVSVQINGDKFIKDTTVKLSRSGEEDINATGVKLLSAQKLSCSFDLKNKTLGKWDVVVTNKKFRHATLSGGFLIGSPAPSVTGVTPGQSNNNARVGLTIKGSAFRSGAAVLLSNRQMDIGATKIQVLSDTQINCEVDLNQADPGVYEVKVVNNDGKAGGLVNGFTVTSVPKPVVVEVVRPTIEGITPNKGFNNGMILTRIDGKRFETGSLVKLSRNGQEDLPGLNIKVEGSTQITCFFDISGQPEGSYNVEVTNPSGQKAFLENGFLVENFVPTSIELNKAMKAVYFDFDKAELRQNQVPALKADLVLLKKYPELYIILGGHTDERGSIEYNLELSSKRANGIKKYLAEQGIDPKRITIYAYGKEFPAAPGHNESSWWQNRRVEIRLWESKPSKNEAQKK
jgi:outer membrane protein OmpA-like peptidoglycan-associated protein